MSSFLPKQVYNDLMKRFRGEERENQFRAVSDSVIERALELSDMIGELVEERQLTYPTHIASMSSRRCWASKDVCTEARWRMRDLITSQLRRQRIDNIVDLPHDQSMSEKERAAQDLAGIFDSIEARAKADRIKKGIRDYAEFTSVHKFQFPPGGGIVEKDGVVTTTGNTPMPGPFVQPSSASVVVHNTDIANYIKAKHAMTRSLRAIEDELAKQAKLKPAPKAPPAVELDLAFTDSTRTIELE